MEFIVHLGVFINPAINQAALNLLLKPTMKLKDARTIPPEQLYERRKQAIALFEKGMTRQEIAPLVGVGRNAVGGMDKIVARRRSKRLESWKFR